MLTRSSLVAGYRRAAAGVVGCVLVGGAMGAVFQERHEAIAALKTNPPTLFQTMTTTRERPENRSVSPRSEEYVSLDAVVDRQLRADYARPKITTYIVQTGDTLWDLADQFETNTNTLLSLNPQTQADLIKPGQKLRVVRGFLGAAHEVEAGDTLSGIATAYGLSIDQVAAANAISPSSTLQVGKILLLPGARSRPWKGSLVSRGDMRRESSSLPPGSGNWVWPIVGGIHSTEFSSHHSGLDIAVPNGTVAVAARAGTVSFSGWDGGYGYSVLIDHGDGFVTRYSHASQLLVRSGQNVDAGQPVIAVGSTGNSTGPHLHLEFLYGGRAVNPKAYLP